MNLTDAFALFLIIFLTSQSLASSESPPSFNPNESDYYKLLGIDRSADNRDIRKAFKKLALTLHPDKNPTDPKAHDTFLKISRAYEILKDTELREIYNSQGEKGLKDKENGFSSNRGQYQNWNYYAETFGIYDNDEEIITLSTADFEASIRGAGGSDFIWFINYYSPHCSHCHILAPEWRKMAKELGAIIRIGAINCGEDRPLCQAEGIRAYPSLILYPFKIKFEGERSAENLIAFVVKNLHLKTARYNDVNMDRLLAKLENPEASPFTQTLVIACFNRERGCLPEKTVNLLTYKVQNLLQVINLACSSGESRVCEHFGLHKSTVALYPNVYENPRKYYPISADDVTEEPVTLFRTIMEKFPPVGEASKKEVQLVYDCLYGKQTNLIKCSDKLAPGWILAIVDSSSTTTDESFEIELKSLAQFMSRYTVRKLVCSSSIDAPPVSKNLCSKLSPRKIPGIVTLKASDEFTSLEHYYGRLNAIDLLHFCTDSFASQVRTLTESDFSSSIAKNPEPSLVQFYAPWCPACKTAKATLKKVSGRVYPRRVTFGLVDCAVHIQLCRSYNIRSYPTVILYNDTFPHQYSGKYQQEEELVEFIENTLQSSVWELNPERFKELVEGRRDQNTVWAVDFYSPYCAPCQALAPIWRKLSNMMEREEPTHLRLGALNCAEHQAFCRQLQVQSYPTLRVYPSLGDAKHGQSFYRFNEQRRDVYMLRSWLYDFLPYSELVNEITSRRQFEDLLTSSKPSLVDFYAPWALSSKKYGPDFMQLSKNLTEVSFLRLNCKRFSALCEEASVEYFPTVRLYGGGGHRSSAGSWTGIHIHFPGSGGEDLISSIRSLLPKSVIKEEL